MSEDYIKHYDENRPRLTPAAGPESTPSTPDELHDLLKNARPGQVAHVAWAMADNIVLNSDARPGFVKSLWRAILEVVAVHCAHLHGKASS